MSFSEPFIRRPVGTTLLAIGLFLIGAVAYQLPAGGDACPNVDFPIIRVSASRPGADPTVMAATVARAAGAPARQHRGRQPDHLDQLARHHHHPGCSSTSAATSTAPRATCRRRSTPSLADLPSDLPSLPRFRKANPAAAPVLVAGADLEDDLPTSALYDVADTVLVQRISQIAGRGRGDRQRRRAAGGADRAQPGRAVPTPASRPTTSGTRSSTPIRSARSASSRATGRARRSPSTSRCARAQSSATSSSRDRTATWSACPTSPRSTIASATRRSVAWFNKQPAVLLTDHQAGRRQRHRHRRPRSQALIPDLKKWIPAGVDISILADRTGTIRASVLGHAVHAAGDRGAGDGRGVRVPAAVGADDRRRRLGAAGAGRHLCRRCGWPASRSTICR